MATTTTTIINVDDIPVNEEGFYDEVEIEDFDWNEEEQTYYYPCPCGDRFQITLDELIDGEEVATCPSCSLIVRVIYNPEDFEGLKKE